MVHILIVEDQAIVRNGLKMIVQQEPDFEIVAEASNGVEALAALENHHIDIVLMDVRMPEMNGIEATKRIRNRFPYIKVLVLTTFDDEEYAFETLKNGANGFLLKSAEPHKLIGAIHSVLEGGLVLNEDVAAKLMPKLLKKTSSSQQVHTLTERELDVVKLVGEGKTNKEISEELFLSIGTVKNYMTHILQELELRDRTQLAIYAVRNGLA